MCVSLNYEHNTWLASTDLESVILCPPLHLRDRGAAPASSAVVEVNHRGPLPKGQELGGRCQRFGHGPILDEVHVEVAHRLPHFLPWIIPLDDSFDLVCPRDVVLEAPGSSSTASGDEEVFFLFATPLWTATDCDLGRASKAFLRKMTLGLDGFESRSSI